MTPTPGAMGTLKGQLQITFRSSSKGQAGKGKAVLPIMSRVSFMRGNGVHVLPDGRLQVQLQHLEAGQGGAGHGFPKQT